MDMYPKIEVSNVGVINVTFRRANFLYNEGRIVVDVKTYDFAGHLANDVVIGFYRDGVYTIHYYYHAYDFELSIPFEKTVPAEDFTGRQLICVDGEDEFVFTFEKFEPNLQKVYETINECQDLLTGKKTE